MGAGIHDLGVSKVEKKVENEPRLIYLSIWCFGNSYIVGVLDFVGTFYQFQTDFTDGKGDPILDILGSMAER